MTLALVLAGALALASVLLVARPFLREPESANDRLDALTEPERRRLQLAEERDRALAALKELEFDHRTGKVSEEHYREQVGPMRRRAAEALRALDRFAPPEQGQEPAMVEVPDPVPPDEPTPPEPAPDPIPEPYPPPDEATPPEPARVPEPGPLGAKT
jgi:outer membrane biosynthesis protein TonB